MDLWSVLKTIMRRWYVSLPLAILTVVGVSFIPQIVKPSYRAQGTALLAVPTFDIEALKQERQERLNPFLSFNPSLNISAEIISRIVNDDAVRSKVDSLGLDKEFEVFSQQNIPGVTVISASDSPSVATRTVRYVLDQSISTMEQLQQNADVPKDQFIRMGTISYSKKAEEISARQNRARVGLGIFGLALAAGMALLLEALVTYNKKSKLKREHEKLSSLDGEPTLPAARARRVRSRRNGAPAAIDRFEGDVNSGANRSDSAIATDQGRWDGSEGLRGNPLDMGEKIEDQQEDHQGIWREDQQGIWVSPGVDQEREPLVESTSRP